MKKIVNPGPLMYCPEYAAWRHMKRRCLEKHNEKYSDYGGRGILICERWINSFENFYKDMGPRTSSKHSLDRYPNNDGNYEPTNCRWATMAQQARNKRNNLRLEYNGIKIGIADWIDMLGISRTMITNYCGVDKNMAHLFDKHKHLIEKIKTPKISISYSFGFFN